LHINGKKLGGDTRRLGILLENMMRAGRGASGRRHKQPHGQN